MLGKWARPLKYWDLTREGLTCTNAAMGPLSIMFLSVQGELDYRIAARDTEELFRHTADSSALRVDGAPMNPSQLYLGTQLFDSLLHTKRLDLGDTYFGMLASLPIGKLLNLDDLYSELVGKRELHFYRIVGVFIFYFLSYAFRPARVFRTLKTVFFTSTFSTVFEQRLKKKPSRITQSAAL